MEISVVSATHRSNRPNRPISLNVYHIRIFRFCRNGNCGYDRTAQVYHPCRPQDMMCGMLQCRHLNERLEFGMESVASLSAMFINDNGQFLL